MEVRMLFVALAAIMLVGCGGQVGIKCDTQDVYIPVPYVPAPPVVERPSLPVDDMANEKMPEDPVEREKFYGRLSQAYNASIVALQGYGAELEAVIKEYERLSKESKTLEQLIKERAQTVQPQ